MTHQTKVFLLSGLLFFLSPKAIAQVIPDASLPDPTRVIPLPQGIAIEGGTRTGTNLFHSFTEFSLPNGEAAIFNNAPSVENIITRVTGANPSLINGIIQTQGRANLLFLNPNGLIFGPQARLFLGGAFLGTTAQDFVFPNGQLFGRQTPNFALTINTPIGLNFAASSGAISVNNTGHNLTRPSLLTPINHSQKPWGLQTLPHTSLALVGNGVHFNGGVVSVNGGNLAIASVELGRVNLNLHGNHLALDLAGVQPQEMNFNEQSLVDGVLGGNTLSIFASRVTLKDGSLITTQNLSPLPDRGIFVNAQAIILSGIDPRSLIQSGIFSETLFSGNASNITLQANHISLEKGGGVGTTSYGQGSTGAISVRADESLLLTGVSLLAGQSRNSVIGSIALGTGDSPPISITSPTITLTDLGSIISLTGIAAQGAAIELQGRSLLIERGGIIYSSSLNSGKVGNIAIAAEAIELRGFAPNFDEASLGLVITSTDVENLSAIFTNSSGNQGDSSTISLTTQTLNILDGALIGSVAFDRAESSAIKIDATDIYLSGSSISGSQSQIASRTVGTGNGNNININAQRIAITSGGTINTSTASTGNAGSITLRATERITLAATLTNQNPSSISAGAVKLDPHLASLIGVPVTSPTGKGGDIFLFSPTLILAPQSLITSTHEGLGLGGNLFLDVDSLTAEQGQILTTTISGNGGNISLSSDFLLLDHSAIGTSSAQTGNGGNISLHSKFVGLFNYTKIAADAFEGNGGDIFLNTRVLFKDQSSQISARSALGQNGSVRLTSTPFTLSAGFTNPPTRQSLEEVAALSCLNYQNRQRSIKFSEQGRGGEPSSAVEPLSYDLDDLIAADPEQVVAAIRDAHGRVKLLNCSEYWEYWNEGAGG